MVPSAKWEDVDPFRSRLSFKMFLTISEHRFWIGFHKFIAKSAIVADGLRSLRQGDDKVKFNEFNRNLDVIRSDKFRPNSINFTTEVDRRQGFLSGLNFQCLTPWNGSGWDPIKANTHILKPRLENGMLRGVRHYTLILHCVAQSDHNPGQIYGDSEADLNPRLLPVIWVIWDTSDLCREQKTSSTCFVSDTRILFISLEDISGSLTSNLRGKGLS
jgi:hypothetical protein